jgi:Skp family chaperone for outer membrane proteins
MRKTHRQAVGLLILVMGVLASLSYAQQLKIGVVNSQDVLERSSEGKRVLARLQDLDKQNQAKISKLDTEIQQLQAQINTQRLTLTQEALSQKALDLDRKQTQRKRDAEDAYASMQETSNRLLQRIQDELIPIVTQLGKEKGLDIIFDLGKSGAVYFNPTIEVTEDVIKRYDASKAAGK